MRTGSWFLVGSLTVLMSSALVMACSSDSSLGEEQTTTQDGGLDSSQSSDGSKVDVKENCEIIGHACKDHSDCCSATCDPKTHVCAKPLGECKAAGLACTSATECCTMVCANGTCGSDVCIDDGKGCSSDSQCCSGSCPPVADAGIQTCRPLNNDCRTSGNSCKANAECCSEYCDNGRCSQSPSFCVQTGDICDKDTECCAGICAKSTGADRGVCVVPSAPGATGCLVAGEVCSGGATGDPDGGAPQCGGDCCSRSCAPYGPTGVMICQPPSGCRPTGETCLKDADCCGSSTAVGGNGSVKCSKGDGETVGRCDNGQSCRAAGQVCKLKTSSCNAENNCCAGNVNKDPWVCKQDILGIPRCTYVEDCSDPSAYEGKACASSTDCCGLPCVPNSDPKGAPFICGDSCVPSGGACSTTADCCAGLPCTIPSGASVGKCGAIPGPGPDGGVPDGSTPDANVPDGGPGCSFYGQECKTTADCCNEVPCTQGRCQYPVY